jgi:hypothetical protein
MPYATTGQAPNHRQRDLALIASGSALIYHALKGKRPTLRGVGEPDRQFVDTPWR